MSAVTNQLSDLGEWPKVVIVDDEPEKQQAIADLLTSRGFQAIATHPEQLTLELVSRGLVFLVDEYLEKWKIDSRVSSAAQQPKDGLAVAAVIRSLRRETNQRAVIAIRTGMLDDLGAHLPAGQRDSLLAAQHDLEWVFSKAEMPGQPSNVDRLSALVAAAATLPQEWHAETGFEWLGLDGSGTWHAAAKRSIDDARPPAHSVARHTNGRSYLRWLLQRILPFPTFLLSDLYASVRLGLRLADFTKLVNADSPLGDRLREALYRGPLAGFTDRRWWRSALDELLEELGVAGLSTYDIVEALSVMNGAPLAPLPLEYPVVAIDGDYRTLPEPIEAADAIRLAPDGWPVFAEEAWAALADVLDDTQLRAVVAQIDRTRLAAES